MKNAKHLVLILAIASASLLQTACSLTATRASASIQINTGIVNAEAEIEFEREEEERGIGNFLNLFGQQVFLSRVAEDIHLRIEASNASIPDQTTNVTLALRDELGVMAAQTFPAQVQGGELRPSNPGAVTQWISQFEHVEVGKLEISAPSLQINGPQEGHFSVTNEARHGSQTLASASASGFVPGDGSCPGCQIRSE